MNLRPLNSVQRLFLVQFFFTTSETEPDYYHQKVNIGVASRVAEQFKKTKDLRKLGNFKKIPEMRGFVEHSIEKPILLNFVNLSPNFCSKLCEKTNFHFLFGPDPRILDFTFFEGFSILKVLFALQTDI